MKHYLLIIKSEIDKLYAHALDIKIPDRIVYFDAENLEEAQKWRLDYLEKMDLYDFGYTVDIMEQTEYLSN